MIRAAGAEVLAAGAPLLFMNWKVLHPKSRSQVIRITQICLINITGKNEMGRWNGG